MNQHIVIDRRGDDVRIRGYGVVSDKTVQEMLSKAMSKLKKKRKPRY